MIIASVLVFLLVLLALGVVALLIPLRMTVVGGGSNEPYRVVLVWLFGAVRISLREGGRSRGKKRGRPERSASAGDFVSRKSRRFSKWLRVPDNSRAVATWVIRLVPVALRSLRITGRGDVVFGLADPAETGVLWGYLSPLIPFGVPGDVDIQVHPYFFGSYFSFFGHVSAETVPLRILVPMLRFAISREGRAVIRAARGKD